MTNHELINFEHNWQFLSITGTFLSTVGAFFGQCSIAHLLTFEHNRLSPTCLVRASFWYWQSYSTHACPSELLAIHIIRDLYAHNSGALTRYFIYITAAMWTKHWSHVIISMTGRRQQRHLCAFPLSSESCTSSCQVSGISSDILTKSKLRMWVTSLTGPHWSRWTVAVQGGKLWVAGTLAGLLQPLLSIGRKYV